MDRLAYSRLRRGADIARLVFAAAFCAGSCTAAAKLAPQHHYGPPAIAIAVPQQHWTVYIDTIPEATPTATPTLPPTPAPAPPEPTAPPSPAMVVAQSAPLRATATTGGHRELLVAAGWPPELLDQAAAIVTRESRWHADSINPSGATGLFQLMCPDVWCPFFGVTQEDLLDPMTNARLAYAIYLRDGWSPWGGPP